jgi:hypothetical protein
MRKLFTDEQIIGFLTQAAARTRSRSDASSTVSAMPPSTRGAAISAALMCPTPSGSRRWSRRTQSSRRCCEAMLDSEALKVVARGNL